MFPQPTIAAHSRYLKREFGITERDITRLTEGTHIQRDADGAYVCDGHKVIRRREPKWSPPCPSSLAPLALSA